MWTSHGRPQGGAERAGGETRRSIALPRAPQNENSPRIFTGLEAQAGEQARCCKSNAAKVETCFSNGSAQYLDLVKVASTHTQLFGQAQRAIGSFERRSATVRPGVESHERHADRICGHAVRSRDQQAGLDVAPSRSPGTFATASWCGFHR